MSPIRSLGILFFLLISVGVYGMGKDGGICGTSIIVQEELKFRRAHGLDTIPRIAQGPKTPVKVEIDDTLNFWTIGGGGYILVRAVCKGIGEHAYIFVETAEWDAGYVSQAGVDYLIRVFDSTTAADSTRGIYDIDTDVFGDPPLPPNDADNDSLIYILLLDIRREYVAGYFSPYNEGSGPYSNQKEMIYVDSRYGNKEGTSAHEFQHMINWNMDPNEEIWINEGCSTFAELLTGYNEWTGDQYVKNTDVALTLWGGEIKDYEKVFLWTTYLWERVGDEGIRTMVRRQENGIEGVDSMLQELGYSERFIDIHKDYAVALYCDNPDSGFYNGKYGFRSVSIPAPQMAFSVSLYPDSAIDEHINDTGIDYIWFRNLPDSLTVDFDGYNSGTTLTYYPYILHGNSRYSIEIADEFILDENYDGHYATMPSHNYLYMVVVGGESSYMYTIGTSEYGIEEDDVFVTSLRIYPNPSFGNIVIEFNVRRDTPYSVEIYDIMGRAIRSLIVEESKDMIVWDGLDNRGNPVRQGEYFVRLNTGGKSIVEKFTLLK